MINNTLWVGRPIPLSQWARVVFELCLIALILCTASAGYSLVLLAEHLRVTTPLIIVDTSGIHTRDTKGPIFLPWDAIARVDIHKVGITTFLAFWLVEPEIFLSRVSRPLASLSRKQVASGGPTLVLMPLSLGQKPADVLAQIQQYCAAHGVGRNVQVGPVPRIEMPLPPGTL